MGKFIQNNWYNEQNNKNVVDKTSINIYTNIILVYIFIEGGYIFYENDRKVRYDFL